MKNFKFSSLLLVPLLAVLAACGGGGGGNSSSGGSTATPTLKSIAVTAPASQSTTLIINTTLQLTATGTYSDGSTKAMTGLTWTTKSGTATVAQVASTGIVSAKGAGTETITATSTADNIAGSINLTVVTPWTQFAAGGNQTIGLKADGKLYSWGSNIRGQLGDGTSTDRNAPTLVSGNSTLWKQVAVGDRFAVAIRTDGTLWAWGYNLFGQLGDGTQIDRLVPVQVGTAKNWSYVAAGKAHVVALQSTTTGTTSVNSLWVWGSNANGQLGITGSATDGFKPRMVGLATDNWLTVAAGDAHTLAIKSDQTLWAWGDNSNGQLGISGTGTTPAQVGTALWSYVAAGSGHSLAIRNDGTLWGWGKNDAGQVGNATNITQTAPVQIGTAADWARVAGGVSHSIGVRNNGTLWVWGANTEGQLGNGTNDTNLPVQVGNLTVWKSVAAGAYHSAAQRADSSLWTWGRNTEGQLGNGGNTTSSVPQNIPY
ncbi:hypothetical protein GTP44_01885 [Duganella sp. FT50W]|uniref:RCC1-like domain-containing protein n=1 Tax=Duganella lactea TaxID=2692173 RepID=A0A6L8MG10_9BURK|nr:hypothetical protein [Duganella lactea]MYM80712.1 hypothetical protein [Duganella lactea]